MANKSLNRVVLMGNLTRDPELKYIPSGTAVCTFGLATNRTWTTGTGETKEEVQFHRIVAWQKLAELCGKLLAKGRKVYLEGRLVYRSYTGKDGTQKQITEIIMNDFILFDDRYTKRIDENGQAAPAQSQGTEVDYNIDEDLESIDTNIEEVETPVPTKDEKKTDDKGDDDDIPF
ncbi:hypothetical protein A2690_05105 [Candidatus Roizmanbacteria bacterium RIFCSPHIGHO2_01_FULL_39_12b]|uniref:Single-stranded DNA-binding protein n=1 Tax=Candidatus Roizmanbacteria bacterium RIFCSPHIGHO2_01_FULL_39_12b TaxID=1802030 RepID=A0A1F7G9H7_9BACT|nr:MAG: hypothetical protein A2690_05105 [Candidatus Roizmanbacteria bacterium RIFCSPHIGHO2_01_FULL_39_12b]OGK45911.1 MAG: hypothetical protein A3B46_03390 [Candidatus Roizmanbacteria bacterium RIFCSPLOWO2_01_FULL_39_19]